MKVLRARYTLGLVLALLLAAEVGPVGARAVVMLAPAPVSAPLVCTTPVFVNEFHYDNTGTDTGEFIEVVGPAGTDLTGWALVLYNGNGGAVYNTRTLSGIIPNEGGSGYGTVCESWPTDGIQNGSPDGIALVNNSNVVQQFLSYEGTFTAVGGPANGMTSTDVNVQEGSSTPVGYSLQLKGTGECPADFTWTAPSPQSNCGINAGQSFADQAPYVASTTPADGATNVSRLVDIIVNFSENVNVDSGWYNISCSLSGTHTAVVTGGPQGFTLNPNVDFTVGDHCTVTIDDVKVHDQDTRDPPDTMTADYVWSFDVGADLAPSVSSTTPPNGATGVSPSADIVVNFSENVNVAGAWYNINCTSSGVHTAVVTGGPQSFSLNPNADFTPLESCTVVIYAGQVTDQDLDDPPDNMAADYSWSFTVGTAAPPPCGGTYTSIFTIQGSGSTSPIVGSSVTTQGIVVGDFQNSTTELGGFFLQDPWTDSNPATSDGIFVASTTAVNVGDHVRLTGTVAENGTAPATQTRLQNVSGVQICGTGYTISPTPVTLPIPAGDTLYLEKYEDMLVIWPQVLYVTENYNLGRYGEVLLSSGGRLWQPTNVVLPGAPANALQAQNDLNQITLDDDNLTQNADPIDHPSPGLTAANTLRSGDTVTGLTGCMSQGTSGYTGTDKYRVHPTAAPPFVHANPRPAAPAAPGGTVTVASFNVLNYFSTIDTGDPICGPLEDQACRGADSSTEFTRQRNKIIPAIVGLNADVMGLMELENHPTDAALTNLVSGLNAYAGAGTFAKISTGPVGSDAIKTALIYRPARVTPVGAYMVDTNSINNRPTLAQTFQQNSTGEKFTVVVNHLKSKGCDGATGQDLDQGDGQSCFNYTRVQQATRLNTWINGTVIPTSGDPDVIMIGDFNAYALENPITTLTGFGYTNLVNQFNGLYTYSYVYMGQSGYLDHALATASIVPQVVSTSHWHINPDEPYVLDYNVEYKSTNQQTILYAANPYRSSDHDPVLIGLYPFDFSDLATSYGTAWHGGNGTLKLGSGWTADPTFGPNTDNATDDGMTMEPGTGWAQGATVRIYAQVTGGGGYLAGWFDWNNDGDFGEAQEKSVARNVSAGANTIDFTIPTGAGYTTPGRVVTVRFRLYPGEPGMLGTETPTGGTSSGEVEDSVWTPPVPTAVKLVSFGARAAAGGLLLSWETASEDGNAGFNLYRSTSTDILGEQVNVALIPSAAPGGGQGASYTFLDGAALPGVTWYYTLEDVALAGGRTLHGPVEAALWRSWLPLVAR